MSHQISGAVIAASLAPAVSFSAWADLTGKVVGVAVGDSITFLHDREQVKVRLMEIDASEKGQRCGPRLETVQSWKLPPLSIDKAAS